MAILVVLLSGFAMALRHPRGDLILGGYATHLNGRTTGQRKNAELAARRLDGRRIESGDVLSFNRVVGPWSPDRGFVIAPVSYDGELVADWGGGVCQTSTTLYNAALVAGLEIAARSRHTWAPKYVSPGRDAAVAQRDIDLRIRNPYPWPVTLHARLTATGIGFTIEGAAAGPMAEVEAQPVAYAMPIEVLKTSPRLPKGTRRILTTGKPGARVTVYRRFLRGPQRGSREMVSMDAYPAMNRVVVVNP